MITIQEGPGSPVGFIYLSFLLLLVLFHFSEKNDGHFLSSAFVVVHLSIGVLIDNGRQR